MYKSYEDVHYLRGAYGEILAVYEGGSLAYWNILSPDGTPIGRRESGGTLRYYHRDHLGSTRAVATADSVTEAYDFMPFGMEMDRSLTNSGPVRNKFTGHETDEETQLVHMEWRGYLAEFGRFLSVDPHAENYPSLSPYVYAANNPLIFIDPDGRDITIKYNCNDKECEEWVFTGDNAGAGREIGNEFINQFLDAYEYAAEKNSESFLVKAATDSDMNVHLKHFNDSPRDFSINSHYRRADETLYWLPLGGVETKSGVLSPTTVLEHEFAHAWSHKNKLYFSEMDIIRKAETPMARSLGEINQSQVSRFRYEDGDTVAT